MIDERKEGQSKSKEDQDSGEQEQESAAEPSETSDEIARIYWKWFASNRIVFLGRITSRSEFLPKCGKMGG